MNRRQKQDFLQKNKALIEVIKKNQRKIDFFKDFDSFLSDLDGVLYKGNAPVANTSSTIKYIQSINKPFLYITNNASRSLNQIAEKLQDLDIPAKPEEIFVSSMVAVNVLSKKIKKTDKVLVLGSQALVDFIENEGYQITKKYEKDVKAVVQGFNPAFTFQDLCEACFAIENGAIHIVTNIDNSIPLENGDGVGNGGFAKAIFMATKTPFFSCGKPKPDLYKLAKKTYNLKRPLFIGDRPETDIWGARRANIDSVLVFTGITSKESFVNIKENQLPTYVITDFSEFLDIYYLPVFYKNFYFLFDEKNKDLYSCEHKQKDFIFYKNGEKTANISSSIHFYRLFLSIKNRTFSQA